MCILTEMIYAACTTYIPETEWCPRCPDEEWEKHRDFKREIELKEGVWVGLVPCPFFRCRPRRIVEQEMLDREEMEKELCEKLWS